MLNGEDPRLVLLRQQAKTVRVVGRYEDGGASIELSVDREGIEVPHDCWPITEARTRGQDAATFFELLLFVDERGLTELEIVHYGDVIPTEFPPPEKFEPPVVPD